ncbi:hypothetical protein PVK06_034123 [Gossypium arboreum]|uniref:Uncharacterized protein n=1 Tax=Gossypium arboreum TaxID=29729 RepID=A0ABR0NDV0_GOSAR|nr:hypothetical protein PVK06_034123 [Gossypium arboreum]
MCKVYKHLGSNIKYVDDSVLHDTTVVDPSNEGGNTLLRELHILMPQNIIGVKIEKSSMTSVLALRCGSRHYPSIPTTSFEVDPTVCAEIEEPSILSATVLRLGTDLKP